MTREEILDQAKNIIAGERQEDYGDAKQNFELIADLWSGYLLGKGITGPPLRSHDIADMMILLKVARNAGDNKTDDSYIDIAGYAALGGELNGSRN